MKEKGVFSGIYLQMALKERNQRMEEEGEGSEPRARRQIGRIPSPKDHHLC